MESKNILCFPEPRCIPRDSDACLKRAYYWGNTYSCDYFKWYPNYCTKYERDGRRCCPEACNNLEPFTEEKCVESISYGVCDYSPEIYEEGAQCPQGKSSFFLNICKKN